MECRKCQHGQDRCAEGRSSVDSGPISGPFRTDFGPIWGHSGLDLDADSMWCRSGIHLRSISGRSGFDPRSVDLGSIRASWAPPAGAAFRVDLVVVGSAAVSPSSGARFDRTAGATSAAYAMLRLARAVTVATPVVTHLRDSQLMKDSAMQRMLCQDLGGSHLVVGPP